MSIHVLPGLEATRRRTRLEQIRRTFDEKPKDVAILDVVVPPSLVEELMEKFPNTCPSEDVSHDEICRRQGEQRVITRLVHAVMQQQPCAIPNP